MDCPACNLDLSPITVDCFDIAACRTGCGGVWLDGFAYRKIRLAPLPTQTRLAELNQSVRCQAGPFPKRTCPACATVIMMRHLAKPGSVVEVDECCQCGGIWLDGNELAQILREVDPVERSKSERATNNQVPSAGSDSDMLWGIAGEASAELIFHACLAGMAAFFS